jgi:Uma2 family endonuclease
MNAPSHILQSPATALVPPAIPDEPVYGVSVAAYHVLIEAGMLQSGDPVELLEGWLVPKMPKGPKHERARRMLRRLLEKMISADFFVDEQGALTTSDSEPEPDVLVVRGEIDDFADRHAGPSEVALVAEVADSTLRRDRTRKYRLYARAGVPAYWVVNVSDELVEVFTRPSGEQPSPSYADHAVYKVGDEAPVVIDGTEVGRISVASLFGTAR